jgi:hypothetical protein
VLAVLAHHWGPALGSLWVPLIGCFPCAPSASSVVDGRGWFVLAAGASCNVPAWTPLTNTTLVGCRSRGARRTIGFHLRSFPWRVVGIRLGLVPEATLTGF